MLAIKHIRFSPCHEALVTSNAEEYSTAKHRYALGYEPPNYPVPALRQMVVIEPDRVTLWTDMHPDWDAYLFITKQN